MTNIILSAVLIFNPSPIAAPKAPAQWQELKPTVVAVDSVPTTSLWYPHISTDIAVGSIAETESPAPPEPPPPLIDTTPRVLTDAQLYRLRMCESTNDYGAHYVWGTRWESRATGAYQFEQPTWDGVAARHMPWLVGVKPQLVSPAEQDNMTRWLWSERGRYPWPVCGLRVGAP